MSSVNPCVSFCWVLSGTDFLGSKVIFMKLMFFSLESSWHRFHKMQMIQGQKAPHFLVGDRAVTRTSIGEI